nr:unnamed protein product [Callosobruchus chinensis]
MCIATIGSWLNSINDFVGRRCCTTPGCYREEEEWHKRLPAPRYPKNTFYAPPFPHDTLYYGDRLIAEQCPATLLQLGPSCIWRPFEGPGIAGPNIIDGAVSGGLRTFEDDIDMDKF